jgi:hypothetical protein
VTDPQRKGIPVRILFMSAAVLALGGLLLLTGVVPVGDGSMNRTIGMVLLGVAALDVVAGFLMSRGQDR